MSKNKKQTAAIRDRMARTNETFSTARMHVLRGRAVELRGPAEPYPIVRPFEVAYEGDPDVGPYLVSGLIVPGGFEVRQGDKVLGVIPTTDHGTDEHGPWGMIELGEGDIGPGVHAMIHVEGDEDIPGVGGIEIDIYMGPSRQRLDALTICFGLGGRYNGGGPPARRVPGPPPTHFSAAEREYLDHLDALAEEHPERVWFSRKVQEWQRKHDPAVFGFGIHESTVPQAIKAVLEALMRLQDGGPAVKLLHELPSGRVELEFSRSAPSRGTTRDWTGPGVLTVEGTKVLGDGSIKVTWIDPRQPRKRQAVGVVASRGRLTTYGSKRR